MSRTKKLRPVASAKTVRRVSPRAKQPSNAELLAQMAVLMRELAEAKKTAAHEATLTLNQFLPEWRKRHMTSRLKVGTRESYEKWLDKTLLPRFGNLPLVAITTAEIDAWKGEQLEQGYAINTTHAPLKLLKVILRCAHEWDRLRKVPKIIIKKPKKKQPHCKEDEYELLVRYAATRPLDWLALVLLSGDGGMRHGEVAGLRWPNVGKRDIDIVEQRDEKNRTKPTKNSGTRQFKMTDRLAAVMAQLRARDEAIGHDGHVFHINGKPVCYDTIGKRFRTILRKCGLGKRVVYHSLRHTFISDLSRKNVPLADIMTLVGHSDLATTQGYIHVDQSNLHHAIDKLDR